MKTKINYTVVTLCCILLTTVGCTLNAPNPSATQIAPTPAKSTAGTASSNPSHVVRVAVIPFTGNAPIYVADQENLCAQYGIQLQIVDTNDQSALDTVMAKGEVEVGMYANTSLAFAAAAGLPLRAFLTIDKSLGADGVAVAGGINSIEDMVKQRTTFAADETDTGYFLFMAVAEKKGFEPSDFNHVPIAGVDALTSAFLAGKVDAVAVAEPSLSMVLQRKDAHILLSSKDYPGYITDVFAAMQTTLDTKTGDLVALSRCWYDAISRVKSDPESAMPLMAQRLGLDESQLRDIMPDILWPDLAEGRKYLLDGELRDSLQFANDFYGRLKQLAGNPVPPDKQITDAVVKQLD